MKTIQLANGRGTATVDDADYEAASKHHWCLHIHLGRKKTVRYAQANLRIDGGWRRVLLHRFVMGLKGPKIDHVDGDGLNCRRGNLRPATRGQNQHNQPARRGRFKGVSWNRASGKWVAQIMANRKYKYLGLFPIEEDAARAYDAAARELHGEFARLNFPEVIHA